MKKDPKIFGQYVGGGRYSTETYFPRRTANSSTSNVNKDTNIREYLFGTAEILSGILCVWLLPTPGKYVLGAKMAYDGSMRIYNVVTNIKSLQQDISITELYKTTEKLKVAAE